MVIFCSKKYNFKAFYLVHYIFLLLCVNVGKHVGKKAYVYTYAYMYVNTYIVLYIYCICMCIVYTHTTHFTHLCVEGELSFKFMIKGIFYS